MSKSLSSEESCHSCESRNQYIQNESHFLNRPKIGVIAGMGPKSTAPFLDKTINYFQKHLGFKNDEDFPYMHIISLPTPFRVTEIIDKKITLIDLKIAIEALTENKMNFIVIPCNTVHAYYEEYKKFTSIPILNIVDETVNYLVNKTAVPEVALLATEVTLSSQIYQNKLKSKNYNVILDNEIQTQFNKLLLLIKNSELEDTQKLEEWNILEHILISKGARTIVSACTDISFFLIQAKIKSKIEYFDSMEILAEKTVEFYSKL